MNELDQALTHFEAAHSAAIDAAEAAVAEREKTPPDDPWMQGDDPALGA